MIGNAAKYSDNNSSSIQIDLDQDEDHVVISVIDHGQGIPDDQHEIIFERFQRAEGVTLRRGDSSSGLGHSIVKMLMDGMGGSVGVKSRIGVGSRFVLTLQRAQL